MKPRVSLSVALCILTSNNINTYKLQEFKDRNNIIIDSNILPNKNNKYNLGSNEPEFIWDNIFSKKLHIDSIASHDSGIEINSNVDISGNLNINSKLGLNNNVDISGNLNINSKIGLNNNYGNTGDVLISNGTDNPVSWREPVYYSAYLSSDIAMTYGYEKDVTGLTIEIDTGSFNEITGEFTAPRTAVYSVMYTVLVQDTQNIRSVGEGYCRLKKKPSGGSYSTSHETGYRTKSNDEGFRWITMSLNTLIELNVGDKIKCAIWIKFHDGEGARIEGYSNPKPTWQSVHSIT